MSVDFILTADWHLHWKAPAMRKDNFIDAQWRKVKFIAMLQKKYRCPVLNAGDTFDTWKSDTNSKMLECMYMMGNLLPYPFITVYGQHEMPMHSMENVSRSPLNLLGASGRISIIPNGDCFRHKGWKIYGKGFGHEEGIEGNPRSVLLMHELVWKKEAPFPGAPAEGNVRRVMENNPGHRLIVSGDNHTPFTYKKGYRSLVNCGSMMRRTKAQKDYRPAVWLYSRTDGIKRVGLPIEEDVWKSDTESIGMGGHSFDIVDRINDTAGVSNDFEENIRRGAREARHPVKLKVRSLMKETS